MKHKVSTYNFGSFSFYSKSTLIIKDQKYIFIDIESNNYFLELFKNTKILFHFILSFIKSRYFLNNDLHRFNYLIINIKGQNHKNFKIRGDINNLFLLEIANKNKIDEFVEKDFYTYFCADCADGIRYDKYDTTVVKNGNNLFYDNLCVYPQLISYGKNILTIFIDYKNITNKFNTNVYKIKDLVIKEIKFFIKTNTDKQELCKFSNIKKVESIVLNSNTQQILNDKIDKSYLINYKIQDIFIENEKILKYKNNEKIFCEFIIEIDSYNSQKRTFNYTFLLNSESKELFRNILENKIE